MRIISWQNKSNTRSHKFETERIKSDILSKRKFVSGYRNKSDQVLCGELTCQVNQVQRLQLSTR